MKEAAFILQNKEKWLKYEALIKSQIYFEVEELSELYSSLINDLAFAQTYYPESKTVEYLNLLCGSAFQKIYKIRRRDKNKLSHFFRIDVPLIMLEYHRYMILAFILFFVSVGIGVLSSIYDDTFVRLILGDYYVDMTLDNIAAGNPMAVYTTGSNWGGFLAITFNNITVSLKAFVFGITGGLGTAYIALYNGIMLGSFQYLFVKEGVLLESLSGIWLHGAMEIFSIVIATMAGLIFGGGILFPGTYSLLASVKRSFNAGVKLFFSTVPFFIFAGFIEGFVTRYSKQMNPVVNVMIILGTLCFISYYYLFYPNRIKKSLKNVE